MARIGQKRPRNASYARTAKRPYSARTNYPRSYKTYYGSQRKLGEERKVIETAQSTVAVNTTGSVTLINGVATGTDFTDRIGRRTNVTAIQLRGILGPDVTNNVGTASLLRVMIVEDTQINGGALPVITDILQAATPTAFMNLNNRERFKVHMDETHAFGPINITATSTISPCPGAVGINVYKKVMVPVTFELATNVIGAISSGALYVVTVGAQAAGVQDGNFTFSARVRFVDA